MTAVKEMAAHLEWGVERSHGSLAVALVEAIVGSMWL